MELTNEQLHTLRHMLGINTPNSREPKPYRNHAAVNPGDQEFAELERLGAVQCVSRASMVGGVFREYDCFVCTVAGKIAAMRSHRSIRNKRSKRMYARYLSFSDACPDVSFKKFLTSHDYADIRTEV